MNDLELESMRNSFKTVVEKRKAILKDPKTEKLRKKVQEIRRNSIENNEKLIKIAEKSFKNNGIDVFHAKNSNNAIELIDNILLEEFNLKTFDSNNITIAKAKSNTLREIGLNEHFEGENIQVIDTDLGDRILQLKETDNSPTHPTGPACHLNRFNIADIVNKAFNINISSEPREIMDCVKVDVLDKLKNAKVGISGANTIAADDGSIILVHNEGNISLVSMMDLHIVVAGIDKLVDSIEDGISVAKLETIYATGSPLTSYINVISGPSKTADIEKKILKNMYGSKRVVLILLDNGRKKVMETIPESLECIGCGSCILTCPIYNVTGNEFGFNSYLGGRGVAMAKYIENSKTSFDCGLFKCTLCGQCTKICPVLIPTYDLIEKTRIDSLKDGFSPNEHEKIKENIKNKGSPYKT
ncbi:MAG: LUD domain-containing protein [Methanobrevibacter sp.]|jgi:L-lactate dehydrogenase complex protein LldG|nr:LUD domain-containing protein [Candidatus Methanoflexus mossambicus]